jgi:hypothetical protein
MSAFSKCYASLQKCSGERFGATSLFFTKSSPIPGNIEGGEFERIEIGATPSPRLDGRFDFTFD